MSGEFKQMRESRGAASRELDQRLAGDGMGDAGYDEMIAARAVDAGRSYHLSMSGPYTCEKRFGRSRTRC